MSLNRAVAALGAVAVVGALTVGFSVVKANDAGKPVPRIFVTAGSTWTPVTKLCYNDGKPLTAKQLAACNTAFQKLATANSAKPISIRPNTSFTISVDKQITKVGWYASSATMLVPLTKDYQANNLPLSGVFASSTDQSTGATTTADKGTVLVLERKSASSPDIYGAWVFTLKSTAATS
ncbi:hypothetical protein [Streptacidiphilus sp. PAMC 29251]